MGSLAEPGADLARQVGQPVTYRTPPVFTSSVLKSQVLVVAQGLFVFTWV